MSPLRKIFDAAVNVAVAYYALYADLVPTESLPVKMETAATASDSNALSAYTTRTGAGMRISVTMSAEHFDRSDYDSLPYTLLHECVCRVFQGGSDKDSAFAEGWMDWICFRVSQEVTSGESAVASHFKYDFGLAHRLLDAAVKLRFRHDSERPFARKGQIAAGTMLELIERVTGTKDKAWHAFLQFSFKLNSLEIRSGLRDQFATAVYLYSVRWKSSRRPLEIEKHVEEYLISRDAIGFVNAAIVTASAEMRSGLSPS